MKGRGIHALVMSVLLAGIYFYIVNYVDSLVRFMIVVLISLISGEVTKLIPSYSLLRNTDDKFWMTVLTFGAIITPGVVWNEDLVTSIVGLGLIIGLYVIPCIIYYKVINKYADTPPMLWKALKNIHLNKYEILDKYYIRNYLYAFQMKENEDYAVFSYFKETHTYLQVIRTKGAEAIALIPLNLENESYIKLEWTMNNSDKESLNDEFEIIYTLMDSIDKLKSNGLKDEDIAHSIKNSPYGDKYNAHEVNKHEYNRCKFSRCEL